MLSSETRKQKCGERVNEAEIACVQIYTGKRKLPGFCILGQFWGLWLRGLCQQMGTKGQGQPGAVYVGSQTLEPGVLKIFLVFAHGMKLKRLRNSLFHS